MAPRPTCECGVCRKCKRRVIYRRHYRKYHPPRPPGAPHFNKGRRRVRNTPVPAQLLAATDYEIAWAAGLFEGEGSIILEARKIERHHTRQYKTVRLSLNSTDKDVVAHFHEMLGGTMRLQPQKPPRKDQWKWVLYGYEPAKALFMRFEPWLGMRRTQRFREVLAECAEARAPYL
jgi:hypothetical protein